MNNPKARKLAAIARVAQKQHGVATRAQAVACGYSVSAIARAVERGEWQRLHPGIFLVDRSACPLWSRIMGAVLRAPGRTWASHLSAAALWGFDAPTPLLPQVSTTADLRGGRATIRLVKQMPPTDRSIRYEIPATSPERTLVDLGGILTSSRLEGVIIQALRSRSTDLPRLRDRASSLAASGRRGSGVLDHILETWDTGRTESALEAKLLRLIRRHPALPEPVVQHEVRDRGRFLARVDFAYPERRIAIEADGYRWHSDAATWHRDLYRRNELTRAGWSVLHFTWADVGSRPHQVAATILAAIARAGVPESGTKAR